MLFFTVVVVIALVAWALRLMEQAVKSQEFSFMLAGFLVASSAAAMMTVYFLMSNYVGYLDHVYDDVPLQSSSMLYEKDNFAYSDLLPGDGELGHRQY